MAKKVNGKQLNPTKLAADANGWVALDMGSYKIYTKNVQTTLSGFNGPAFITALGSNLPVGVANFDAMISFQATFAYNGSGSIRFTQESRTTATTINVVGTTASTSSSAVTAYYMVIA